MIKIIASGKLKDKHLEGLMQDYIKRIRKYSKIEIHETNTLKEQPGYTIALSEEGKQLDSVEFAKLIKNKTMEDITFLIGSATGIDKEIKKKSNLVLSLSKMTFPHRMFRLFLIEQIYRAIMINKNIKYHK